MINKISLENVVFRAHMPQVVGGFSTMEQLVGEWQDYMTHIKELKKDDRLFALVADLLVGNVIDSYLSEIMPTYKKKLANNKEFTLFLRIAVAEQLRLSPARYFRGAYIINRVRNEFAHNLEKKTFEDLKLSTREEIKNVLIVYANPCPNPKNTLQENFTSLVNQTISTLIAFSKHVRSLNSYLRDEVFYYNLIAYCQKRGITVDSP